MDFEPENEQGVVYLFGLLHRDLGFKGVERIQSGFPDCVARRRGSDGDRSINIEFEYYSRDFVTHKHLEQMRPRAVRRVTVVCWEDNWLDPPRNVEVVSLKQHLGLRRVWVMSSREKEEYTRFFDLPARTTRWSLPDRAQRGDLVLVYRTATRELPGRIEDIVVVTGKDDRPHRHWGAFGDIRKLVKLRVPLTLEDFRDHYSLGRSAMATPGFYQGRREITDHWPDVYRLIVKRNRKASMTLKPFHPKFI